MYLATTGSEQECSWVVDGAKRKVLSWRLEMKQRSWNLRAFAICGRGRKRLKETEAKIKDTARLRARYLELSVSSCLRSKQNVNQLKWPKT